jgi:hypothetical protein
MGVRVTVCGSLNGAVTLQGHDSLDTCTLGDLRREVARLLDPTLASSSSSADAAAAAASCAKLILAGRVLSPVDDAKPLSELRVTPSSRVLVTRAAPTAAAPTSPTTAAQQQQPQAAAALSAEAARAARLDRLRACAARMAKRDGLRTDSYAFELENQDGSRLQLGDGERQALGTALALHAKGRATLREAEEARAQQQQQQQQGGAATTTAAETTPASSLFARALDELLLADEAFALAPQRLVEATDNRPLLQLDAAWAALRLRDASRLGVWLSRLEQARQGLKRAHGERGERAAALLDRGGGGNDPSSSSPCSASSAAVRCKLEVLTAAALFHSAAGSQHVRRHLTEARGILDRLASLAPDATVAAVSGAMACDPSDAARALRRCGGDASAAIDLLQREAEKNRQRREERRKRSAWRRERARYGKTEAGEFVDGEALERLLALGGDGGGSSGGGWARAEVAEALRACGNDRERALGVLTDPEAYGRVQLAAVARQQPPASGAGGAAIGRQEQQQQQQQQVDGEALALLVSCGFTAEAARAALARTQGGRDAEAAAAELAARGEEDGVLVSAEAAGEGAAGGQPADDGGGNNNRLARAAETARVGARDLRRRRRRDEAEEDEEDEETDAEGEGELTAALRPGGGGSSAGAGAVDEAYDVDQEGALAEVLATYEALVASSSSSAAAPAATAAAPAAGG